MQIQKLNKPLCFGSTPPVPWAPYTQGLGTLAHTMQVDPLNQGISPLNQPKSILSGHPAVNSAPIIYCYTCILIQAYTYNPLQENIITSCTTNR